jgi:hypothetical protein
VNSALHLGQAFATEVAKANDGANQQEEDDELDVFEQKGSHRSLSLLFLQKLFCLRAANVLTTAYEFETERRCFS